MRFSGRYLSESSENMSGRHISIFAALQSFHKDVAVTATLSSSSSLPSKHFAGKVTDEGIPQVKQHEAMVRDWRRGLG